MPNNIAGSKLVSVLNPDGTLVGSAGGGAVTIAGQPIGVTVTGQPIAIVGTVSSSPGKDPFINGSYVFSVGNVAGVVATNNFLSLFNPVGSGSIGFIGGLFISSTTASGSTETEPMRGFRITTATVGTLQAAAAITKLNTTDANAKLEVRTGNPTVTLGAQVFNSPPAISATTSSTAVHAALVPPGLGPFILAEGEGIVVRTIAGDVDQRWNIGVAWGEA